MFKTGSNTAISNDEKNQKRSRYYRTGRRRKEEDINTTEWRQDQHEKKKVRIQVILS